MFHVFNNSFRINLLLKIQKYKQKQMQRKVYFTSLCYLAAYGKASEEGEFTLRQLRLKYGITNEEQASFMQELNTVSSTLGSREKERRKEAGRVHIRSFRLGLLVTCDRCETNCQRPKLSRLPFERV